MAEFRYEVSSENIIIYTLYINNHSKLKEDIMTKIAHFKLEDNSSISIIVDPRLEEAKQAGGLNKIEPKLKESLDIIGKILPDIEKSLIGIREKASAEEICIEFGIALNSKGSVIIASAGIEASFTISATWSINQMASAHPRSRAAGYAKRRRMKTESGS